MSSIANCGQRSEVGVQQQAGGYYYGQRNESEKGSQETEKREAKDFARSPPTLILRFDGRARSLVMKIADISEAGTGHLNL